MLSILFAICFKGCTWDGAGHRSSTIAEASVVRFDAIGGESWAREQRQRAYEVGVSGEKARRDEVFGVY